MARSILLRRCPRCGEGRAFRALLKMNDRCPVCDLRFDRGDPGYFTGAMYVSYAIGVPLIALATLIEYLVLPKTWSLFALVLLAWGLCLPVVPWLWQYSRTIWMHFDQWADPEQTGTLLPDDRQTEG